MRLVSVTVRNYRIHRETTLRFAAGVTLVAGPNESGKSTLVEAIHHALFLRARVTGDIAQSLRSSLHPGHPSVALEIEAEGKRYTIEKTFTGTSAGTTILREAGGRTRHNEEAEEEIHRLLHEDEAGGGRGLADRIRARFAHLWVWQGTSGASPAARVAGDRSMQRLRDRLGLLGGGGVLESASDAAVARRVGERLGLSHTDTGRVKAGSELFRAGEEAAAATAALHAAEEALARLDTAVRQVDGAERALREGTRSEERLRAELDAARARRDDLARIDLALGTARAEAEGARRAHDTLARTDAEIRAIDARIIAAEQALAPARSDLACARASEADHRTRFDAAVAAVGTTTSLHAEAAARAETLAHLERLEQSVAERAGLSSRCERIVRHREAAEALRSRRRELAPVSPAEVEVLVGLERALEAAEAELGAIATRVEVIASPLPVRLGDAVLAAGAAETITAEREIEVAGARVRIVPGGGRSLGECTLRRDDAASALARRLAALSVATVAEARAAAASLAEIAAALVVETGTIEGLGDDTALRELAALDAAIADLRSDVDRLLPAGFVRPEGLEEAQRLARAAEDEARRCALAAARSRADFETARKLVDGAAAEHERLAGRIRVAESTLADLRSRRLALEEQAGPNRSDDLAAHRRAVAEAEDRVAALVRRREAIGPDGLDREVKRLETSLEACHRSMAEAQTSRQVALAALQAAGSADPHEERARAVAREAAAAARLAALERQARALRLLDGLFAEKKRAVEDRFVEPLRQRVTDYLARVFGTGVGIGLDLDGETLASVTIARSGQGGAAFDFGTLSGGTREQVGAALRLAMAEILAADHDGCLPVVFDDAFVNADPDRARALQRMLDLGAERGLQIVVLTCDSSVYDALGVEVTRLVPAEGAR